MSYAAAKNQRQEDMKEARFSRIYMFVLGKLREVGGYWDHI